MLSNRLAGIAVAGKSKYSSNVFKNCCRVEALQLGNIAKLELALVVYMVVAWRLARLVRLGRTHPDLAASALFTEAEWRAAYVLAKKKPPTEPPRICEVIRQIAMLGGSLGRKSDLVSASKHSGRASLALGISWRALSISGRLMHQW